MCAFSMATRGRELRNGNISQREKLVWPGEKKDVNGRVGFFENLVWGFALYITKCSFFRAADTTLTQRKQEKVDERHQTKKPASQNRHKKRQKPLIPKNQHLKPCTGAN